MITVLGGGSWGLTLAYVLSENNIDTLIWARDAKQVQRFNLEHVSKYFNDFVFPSNMTMTDDIHEAVKASDTIVLSLPIKSTMAVVEPLKDELKDKFVVLTAKGLDGGEVISQRLEGIVDKDHLAVLSGPSFAKEVVEKKTTCVVIASENNNLAQRLQNEFSCSFFRAYTSQDVIGVELCGALKNVYAIGSGMLDSKNVGYNTKASYLTRSLHELGAIVLSKGGKETTLLGLSGIGDLILTCSSPLSRNYEFGYNFNGDLTTADTVEGLNTLPNIMKLAENSGIEMPIVNAINEVVYGNHSIDELIKKLMERAKKSEGYV